MRFPLVSKIFFVLLCCMVLMQSCKKDLQGENSDSYIRFTFNGEQYEYRSLATVQEGTNNGINSITIVAFKDFSAGSSNLLPEQLSILIYSNTKITAGTTYSELVKVPTTDGIDFPQVIITHYDKDETGFQTVGTFIDEEGRMLGGFPAPGNIVVNAKVEFTELSDKYGKGTFSGTVYISERWTDGVKYPITNGEFSIKRPG